MSQTVETTEVVDRRAVEEAVIRLGWLVDRRDWAGLVELFADVVVEDNTSLWGGEPVTQPGPDLVARWRELLSRVPASQHLISGVLADVTGDRARATANVVIVLRRANELGGPLWTCGGHYEIELHHRDGRWRITSFALYASWTDGNPHVLTGAVGGNDDQEGTR